MFKNTIQKALLMCFIVGISINSVFSQAPDESRFTKTVLTKNGELDEPMELTFLPDGRILFVERKGNLKSFNPKTKEVSILATIPVNTKYTNREGQVREAEEGLMGIIADQNFATNHWIYMYYADPKETKHVLARWELKGDELVEASKKILLEVPTQREECCHTGGGMTWDKAGNLYLTVGNNTSNSNSEGYAPIDERPNQAYWDDQRGASNTNDLRGKILRIKPKADGTYSIPKGNLFPEGTPKTRPEIYTMGHRNPWRPTIDSKTGYLYWGEVGPDATEDGPKGPRGYDEFNQAKGPGYFGWPYFIGNNQAYNDYNFETKQIGEKFNPEKPINESPNNTGLKDLPPATKAMIWYPYGRSEDFPMVGAAGRSATGGPVFRKADFLKTGKRPFPDYYEGKWLIVEFMRGWIMAITMDENGNYKSMERFLPSENFSSAIDMDFSPEGDLYVLEYGSAWFRGNDNARLVKVEYNAGNRKPVVAASADKTAGAVPFNVKFSSEGTKDADNDNLKYVWTISAKGVAPKTYAMPNPIVTFDKAGVYQATLTVSDAKGAKNSQSIQIKAGNEAPNVSIELANANKTFFFPNQNIDYQVKVSDKEDGSLEDGKISPSQVAVNFDYVPETFDPIEIAGRYKDADAAARFSTGHKLMGKSDCSSCHITDKKSIGPSYQDIAQKYKGDASAIEKLAKKVVEGGGGVWGNEHAMPAHPQINANDATAMVKYILNLSEKPLQTQAYPTKGTQTTKVPTGESGKGGYAIRAAYTDRGSKQLSPLFSEKIVYLRNPELDPFTADKQQGVQTMITPSKSFSMIGNNSYIAFNNIDLTNVKQIELLAQASNRIGAVGGTMEVRLDSPTGKLLGTTPLVEVRNPQFPQAPPANNNNQNAQGGGNNSQAGAGQQRRTQGGGMPDMNAMRRRMSQAVMVDIPAINETHNIYFVFKNDKASPDQTIMQVVSLNFKN